MKTNTINLINRLRKGALVLISIAGFSSLAWSQASYTFATGGATGQFGPTQAQINTAYSASNLSGSVVVVNGIQYWVVPTSGAYSIEAYGAQGFGSFGGRGAKMYGEFQLNGGDTLKIIVGQRGAPPVGSGTNQYGGGGGSFITTMNNTPLVVAGGGGGSWASAFTTAADGSISNSGNTGANGPTNGAGGINGLGGAAAGSGDGGGGLLGNGAGTSGGVAFVNGGNGGIAATNGGQGGFGGGGGGSSWNNRRCGGGGGYSGGGGAGSTTTGFPEGGGAGSFNAGINQDNLAGVQLNDGSVIISSLESFPNDAGVSAITSPTAPVCAGIYPVIANINNYGNNQITPVTIKWSINGVAQSDSILTTLLDTAAGTGISNVSVNLGNVNINGPMNIKIWTTLPNNVADTSNSNDTAQLVIAPSLGGVYTLGTSGTADFISFTNFFSVLNAVGICDSVIVNVEDGTYNEAITVAQVANMSSTKFVTFRGNASNNALTKLTSSSGTTVAMTGGDYFSFEDLTIENTNGNNYVVEFSNAANYNRFENCYFRNNDTTSTALLDALVYSASGTINDYNKFYNNTFKNGSYGLYWWGSGTTALETGNEFVENEFVDQYYWSAYLYYQSQLLFDNNSMHSKVAYTSGRGLTAYYCGNSKFTRNHIYTEPGDVWPLYGMYLGYNSSTSFNNPNQIANNIVSIGDTNNTTTLYYGMYLLYNDLNNIVHNTAILKGGSASARAIYTAYNDYGRFANNIIANTATGYSLYDIGSINLYADNNVYYSDGLILLYNDANYNTLAAWQSNSSDDESSVQTNPNFNDLILGTFCNDTIDNIGVGIVGVMNDFSNNSRSMTTPDPGAHEFFGLSGVNLGPDTTLCQGTFTLTVGDSNLVNAVTWTVGTTTSNAPTYVVQANNGAQSFVINASVSTDCGSQSDNVNITLVPAANLADSTHICSGESIVLSSGGGPTATNSWFPGNQTIGTINVSSPGFYSVTKMEEGCESSSSTIVTQSEGVAVLDIEPCNADLPAAISVAIAGGTGYSWSGGNSPNATTNTFSATGDYAVTATDVFGCVSSDSFSVTVIDVPTSAITQTHAGTYYYFSSTNSTNVGSNATYLWQFGDGGTSTLANPEHNYNWGNPSTPPVYTVTLSITNDCGTNSTTKSYTIDVLGVETTENSLGYSVYPNPTSGVWNVSFAQSVESVSIEVIDIAGRIVLTSENAHSTLIQVDGSNLPSGNYILKVTSDNETAYARVAVAK
jgi:hypothetical protein